MTMSPPEAGEAALSCQTGLSRTLYDLVKIKVWLTRPGGRTSGAHYYILSRYMLARSLQAASISHSSAIKASLLLKRHLVDNSVLSLDQETLERTLFDIILSNGLASARELETWSMVTRFQQSRTPLIILMIGKCCDAKTRVAHTLSSRLHFNYVILTEALQDMMFLEEKEADKMYIFRSLQNDVAKALKDGKSIIIEGDLEHCIDRFVLGAYDEDIVPRDLIGGGLVTVLQDRGSMSPIRVNVRGAREGEGTKGGALDGKTLDAMPQPALVVPLSLIRRGDDEPPARLLLDSGMLPTFVLDENASPEDNSEEIHGWILKAIMASERVSDG